MKRILFLLLALVALALALPQRQTDRPNNNRPGGRPRPNDGNNANPSTNNPPPTNTSPPTNSPSNNAGNTGGNNGGNTGGNTGGSIDASLIPDFGITAGIPSTTQAGSCQGNNNVNIPCKCPPSKADFINTLEQFNAQGNIFGSPFNFNTNVADQSPATQLSRVSAAIVALQNFDQTTKGKGCPAGGAAPNFLKIQAQLQAQV